MKSINNREKLEIIKRLLKDITRGADPETLKKKYGEFLAKTSPLEITLLEQQLVAEGVKPEEILKVCDLHVDLFREYLMKQTIKDIPNGHPLDLLLRENTEILKLVEVLNLYSNMVLSTKNPEEKKNRLNNALTVLSKLKQYIKIHYRKNQMVLFPYLERRGIYAIPRVLWGREDQVLKRIREILQKTNDQFDPDNIAERLLELSKEISDLVFRENKILYPAVWILLSEGEWAAIHEMNKMLGYIVKIDSHWKTTAEPIYPYMVDGTISKEQLEKLPREFKEILKDIKPDNYQVRRDKDLDLGTGFVSIEDLKEIFKSLPIEITYADNNDRVRFFTKSNLTGGFPRLKTIIGRKLEYCHPPRLENYVKLNVKQLRENKQLFREFWTKMGDRIIRVLIVGVRNNKGEYIGTLEVVEDFTDIIRNPEEVINKIVIL